MTLFYIELAGICEAQFLTLGKKIRNPLKLYLKVNAFVCLVGWFLF